MPLKAAEAGSLASATPVAIELLPPDLRPRQDGTRRPAAMRARFDGKGLSRGVFVLFVRYRTDLMKRGSSAGRPELPRLVWSGPGLGRRLRLGAGHLRAARPRPTSRAPTRRGPARRRAPSPDALPAPTTLSTLRRALDKDELELLRPYAPKAEAIRWAVRADARAFQPEPAAAKPGADTLGRLSDAAAGSPDRSRTLYWPRAWSSSRSTAPSSRSSARARAPRARRGRRAAAPRPDRRSRRARLARGARARRGRRAGAPAQGRHAGRRARGARRPRSPRTARPARSGPPRPCAALASGSPSRRPRRSASRRGCAALPRRLDARRQGAARRAARRARRGRPRRGGRLAVPRPPARARRDGAARDLCTGRLAELPADSAARPVAFLRDVARRVRRLRKAPAGAAAQELRVVGRIRIPDGSPEADELRLGLAPRAALPGFVAIEVGVVSRARRRRRHRAARGPAARRPRLAVRARRRGGREEGRSSARPAPRRARARVHAAPADREDDGGHRRRAGPRRIHPARERHTDEAVPAPARPGDPRAAPPQKGGLRCGVAPSRPPSDTLSRSASSS